ncbi:2-oxo acid dehydrogenase subunit E2 [Xanthocytophaga agilis]|uniref:Dihydrolipoamide acetyltransferase component of pyruvate dehydrogenase complex n=1 Tax=Xanthocytophaga agilis TaxID=3048010 RepID=A0AAE3RAM6_9BACT|nr:2-oxo acid dehydrogenase subunit E2 [Xanthocytophaga agilis]MDJ1503857.1 2-oxo acid dehydrogenase subunit E2 [Xanthocytophaga agilis]
MALIEMVMPKMGESIIEGTILAWLKKEGQTIEQDEAVLEVATDKVDTEVPATHSGVLKQILAQSGAVVQVGTPIAIIATEADAEAITNPSTAPTTEIEQEEPVEEVEQHIQIIESKINSLSSRPSFQLLDTPVAGRFYSPLVLTIAREEGISMSELERIPGSGGDNRVTKKDILQYIQSKNPGFTSPDLTPATVDIPEVASVKATFGEIIEPQSENTNTTSLADETLSLIEQVKSIPKEVPTPVIPTPEVSTPTIQETVKQPEAEVKTEAQTITPEPEKTIPQPEKASEEKPSVVQTPEVKQSVTEVKQPVTQTIEPVQPSIKVTEPVQPVSTPAVSYSGRADIIEMDRMRKMIAQRMVDSKRISPHVTSFVEADVTNMVYWRNRVKQEFKSREGDTITFTPVFIEAIAKAIKDYPMINASVEGDKIIVKKDINIGMAVALPSGNLIVPVIKNADQLNLVGLTKKVNDLARRARENKLTVDDLADGTFTMSNVGSFGNVMGTPIIMQPQVAIMAFGAIQKKPAVIETPFGDTLGIRHLMFLSHSYDHRVVDGSLGGMFVRRVADYLEAFDVNRKIFS